MIEPSYEDVLSAQIDAALKRGDHARAQAMYCKLCEAEVRRMKDHCERMREAMLRMGLSAMAVVVFVVAIAVVAIMQKPATGSSDSPRRDANGMVERIPE